MLTKPVFTSALFAMSLNFAAATPPACLLGAVNTQPNPTDLASICGPNASTVQSAIRNQCAGNAAAAMSAFSSICSSAGYDVSTHAVPTQTKEPKNTGKGTITMQPTHTAQTTSPDAHSTSVKSPGNSAPANPSNNNNVAGRIDAEGFAALALMAAGLTIFL